MIPLLASPQAVVIIGAAFIGGAFLVPPSDHDDTDLRTVSIGVFDVDRSQGTAAELRLQYRWEHEGWRLRPLIAAMATSDRALFGCAGIAYDLPVGQRLVITPSFAPGLFYRGVGLDLGYPLEFRSQLEVAYRSRKGGSRIGISFSHVSNAGLGRSNPGTESLMLNYSLAR